MANAQEPVPDSLVGIYVGTLYERPEDSSIFTTVIENQEETIYSIDTTNCQIILDGVITPHAGWNTTFFTDYSYCNYFYNPIEVAIVYPKFFSEDSLLITYLWVSAPPYYTHYIKEFKGLRIPNSSYVGVEQLSSFKTRALIYPNPTNDNLFVELVNSRKEKHKLIVRNVYGIITFEGLITNNNYSINVSNFAKGVYFLEWNNGSEKGIEKFVVY